MERTHEHMDMDAPTRRQFYIDFYTITYAAFPFPERQRLLVEAIREMDAKNDNE